MLWEVNLTLKQWFFVRKLQRSPTEYDFLGFSNDTRSSCGRFIVRQTKGRIDFDIADYFSRCHTQQHILLRGTVYYRAWNYHMDIEILDDFGSNTVCCICLDYLKKMHE